MEKILKFITLLLLTFTGGIIPILAASTPPTIYLAARTDGLPGTGTSADPINISTAAKFDTFFTAQELLKTPATFNFAPGNYYTAQGITPHSGWSLLGAGQGLTNIYVQSTSYTYLNGWGICAIGFSDATGSQYLSSVTIRDITFDNGADYAAKAITAPFTTPGTKNGANTVNVSISSTSGLTVNNCYYVQNATNDANGNRLFYGTYVLTAIRSGTSVTLENTGNIKSAGNAASGTTVPTTAKLFAYCNAAQTAFATRPGIMLIGSGILVDHCTIQNVAMPRYEGPAGISIGGGGAKLESGNQVSNCTIQDTFGIYNTYLELNDSSSGGTIFSQCEFINNTVIGDGYYQGIGGWQYANSHFSNNKISGVQMAYFCDVDCEQNNTISNNIFNLSTIGWGSAAIFIQGSGSTPTYHSAVVDHNTIFCPNSHCNGIYAHGISANVHYTNNLITGPGGYAIIDDSTGAGNVFEGNRIDRAFAHVSTINKGVVAYQALNVDSNGAPVSLGLTNVTDNSPSSLAAGASGSVGAPDLGGTSTANTGSTVASGSGSSSGSSTSSGGTSSSGSSSSGSSGNSAASAGATSTASTLWLAARTDGLAGAGTQSNPFDVSTVAKFDAFFASRYAAHFSNYSSYDPVTFQFLPGAYACSGINAMSGWHFIGSGPGTTILRITAGSYASDSTKALSPIQGISCSYDARDIQVRNLTLDGGVRATGIPVSTGFTMPGPRESVEVTVSNPALMSLGKWYYVQDTAMTHGHQQWWGIMTCTAINGSTVTLQNAEVPAVGTITGDLTAGSPLVRNISSTASLEEGQTINCPSFSGGSSIVSSVDTSTQATMSSNATATANRVTLTYNPCFTDNGSGDVPATAYLFPAGSRSGIDLQSSGIQIENVTVQDVSMPLAEGPVGIAINNSPVNQTSGSGNVIEGCTVQDVFGIYGDYLSAENSTGSNGITEQVNMTNNTVLGNGYSNGLELAGIFNSAIAQNTVSNVNTGLEAVSGGSASDAISGNSFSGANGIYLGVVAPGYFVGGSIRNNSLTLTSSIGTGIRIAGNVSNMTVSGNTIAIENTSDGSQGIVLDNRIANPGSDTITNNQIASSLTNEGIDSGTNQIASSSSIQQNVVLGTAAAIPLQVTSAVSLRTDPGSEVSSSIPAAPSGSSTSSSDPTANVASLAAGLIDPANQPPGTNAAQAKGGTSLDPENALMRRLNQDVALLEVLSSDSAPSQAGSGRTELPKGLNSDPNNLQDTKLVAELDLLINQLQAEIQK